MAEITPVEELNSGKMSHKEAAITTGGIILGAIGSASLVLGAGKMGIETNAIEVGTVGSLLTSAANLGKYTVGSRTLLTERARRELALNARKVQLLGAKAAFLAHVILKT